MALPRTEVVEGLLAELAAFTDLVRSLSPEDMARPSRCEGWSAGDVAAHVAGGMADVTTFNLDGVGTPEFTARQVDQRRGRSAAELAEELDGVRKVAADLLAAFDDATWNGPAPAGVVGTLGEGVETLWYDTYLHGEDIRAALGRPAQPGPGLHPSVAHIALTLDQQGWGPATIALDGLPPFDVNGGESAGGRRVTGDPMAFVLAATGRTDPAAIGLDETVNIYR